MILSKLRFAIWPVVKIWLRYHWWVIRYGGKKKIPKKEIFDTLFKSMQSTADNMRQAQRVMPDDLPEEERMRLREAMIRVDDLKSSIDSLKDEEAK